MVYSIILIMLAAICNAVMDTITHHWEESVFDKPTGEITDYDFWWNPEYSWINKYHNRDTEKPIKKICFGLFDKPFTDAWHTFKSLMICFLMLAVLVAWLSEPPFLNVWWFCLAFYIFLGLVWNLTFNLFYNKILVIK